MPQTDIVLTGNFAISLRICRKQQEKRHPGNCLQFTICNFFFSIFRIQPKAPINQFVLKFDFMIEYSLIIYNLKVLYKIFPSFGCSKKVLG